MIVRSGIPAVLAAGSVELGQAVAQITPGSITMSSVIANVLSQFDDGAVIAIDPHTGKVYAASPLAKRTALTNAVEGDGTITIYAPDGGQSGRSLKWTKESGAGLNDDEVLTTAVKPSFTVESLVNRLLALMQAEEAADPGLAGKHFLLIDQVAKEVHYVTTGLEEDARTALDAVVLNAADAEEVKVSLTPEEGESSPASLPFEGGTV